MRTLVSQIVICIFQPNGVEKIHPLGQLSKEEEELLAACLPELKKNIEKGKKFVQS